MSRVNKKKLKDKPRYLRDHEIRKILEFLPKPKCISERAATKEDKHLKDLIFRCLSEHKICPSKVPQLTKELVKACYNCEIDEGDPVGIAGSNALSATATQSVLNIFHKAGDIGVSGTEKMVKIMKAQKMSRVRDMTTKIYFNYHISKEMVKEMKISLEQATIKDIILDTNVIPFEDITSSEYWYKYYKVQEVDNILRVYLNPSAMYRHNLLMSDVYQAFLRKTFNRKLIKKDVEMAKYITIIPSPTHLFYIDFFFKWDPNDFEGDPNLPLLQYYMNEDFIYHEVIMSSFNTTIKGVVGCEDIRIMKHTLGDYILKKKEMKGTSSNILLNKELFHRTPLILTAFEKLLASTGINVIEKIHEYSWILDKVDIYDIISEYGEKDDDGKNTELDTNVYYLLSTGNNIIDILRYPGVSHRYTISDDTYKNLEIYGIGNARHTLIDNIRALSDSSTVVNPSYSTMMSSLMTITGAITGCTSNGLDKIGQVGALELACFERAMIYIKNSSFMGNATENTTTVTTNLLNGQRIKTGTGLHYVAMRTDKGETYIDSDIFNMNIPEIKEYLRGKKEKRSDMSEKLNIRRRDKRREERETPPRREMEENREFLEKVSEMGQRRRISGGEEKEEARPASRRAPRRRPTSRGEEKEEVKPILRRGPGRRPTSKGTVERRPTSRGDEKEEVEPVLKRAAPRRRPSSREEEIKPTPKKSVERRPSLMEEKMPIVDNESEDEDTSSSEFDIPLMKKRPTQIEESKRVLGENPGFMEEMLKRKNT